MGRHLKMLTPPGPIKSPTAIRTIPVSTPPLNIVTMPQITSTTYDLSSDRATIGLPYRHQLNASGGMPPYQWSFTGNAPDPGLQLLSTGILTGTTTLPNDCDRGPARFSSSTSGRRSRVS